MHDKAIVGVLGAIGASYVTYKVCFPWLSHDVSDLLLLLKSKAKFESNLELGKRPLDFFEETATRNPDKYFIIFNDTVYTYGQILEEANKVANIAKTWNLKKGEAVALFMANEPAFASILFGLQKLGIPTALINHYQRKDPLAHCFETVDAKVIISGGDPDLVNSLQEIEAELRGTPLFVYGPSARDLPVGFNSLSDLLLTAPSTNVGREARAHTIDGDPYVYIFTSGTTGLPKPAILTHVRATGGCDFMPSLTQMTSEDVVYTTVPLYHTSGFLLGLLGTVGSGCTMVLRKQFSVSHFWEDCRKHKVTVVQYIGELFRYLLTAPPDPRDGQHCIRVAFGNGLRRDIWEKVQTRFRIPKIIEFFGATEGPTAFVNLHNMPGACGRYSPLMSRIDPFPKAFVKYEPGTSVPLRDKNGWCMKVKRGDPGLLLAVFPDWVDPKNIYKASAEVKEKKLVRDVFKKGDLYFNYGDVLYLDRNYFLHFADRIGDTFRWKGENVSTLEVANIIATLDFIEDANVYGVKIPGQDGRAGMACLVLTGGSTDLTDSMCQSLYSKCEESLPTYSRPLFLRIEPEMEVTETHKQRKVNHVRQGFDPNKISVPLYFLDAKNKSYVPLTDSIYRHVVAGKSKL